MKFCDSTSYEKSTSHTNNKLVAVQMDIPQWMPHAGEKAWVVVGRAKFKTREEYKGELKQRALAIEEAQGLPDNFYLLVPESFEGKPFDGLKRVPAFVASNKGVYYYVVPDKK